MIQTIRQTVHYLDHSNVMPKQEFAELTFRRASLLTIFAIIALVIFSGIGSAIVDGGVSLQVLGIVLDVYAALVLAGTTLVDRLAELHFDSHDPDAVSITHSEQTRIDLRRTSDHVIGLILLVIGFTMQLPAALFA